MSCTNVGREIANYTIGLEERKILHGRSCPLPPAVSLGPNIFYDVNSDARSVCAFSSSSCTVSVCLSVCPSVRPYRSNTGIVSK